jgi:hypothetical protein
MDRVKFENTEVKKKGILCRGKINQRWKIAIYV